MTKQCCEIWPRSQSLWIFTETAVEVTSITTLYAKAPEVLFDVRMMSPNNFLDGMEMKLANTILAALCLEIIETLPGYLVAIFGPIMIMSTMTRSCFRNVGDAGNISLVDAGAPLGATAVVTPGSAGYLLWECCILASL